MIYLQRLSELILAGYAIDPGKRLPEPLRRGWFSSHVPERTPDAETRPGTTRPDNRDPAPQGRGA